MDLRIISGKARGTNLYSLEGENTRPTLDRVKESLFNIIQTYIPEANVLDLFAGSGALGIEAISRGAKKAIFCDKSYDAIKIIKKNIEKTRFAECAEVIQGDYLQCIRQLKQTYDIIFVDPPYKANIAISAIDQILQHNLLSHDGIIILETDEEERELENLKQIDIKITDLRRYGRVKLIFLNRKG